MYLAQSHTASMWQKGSIPHIELQSPHFWGPHLCWLSPLVTVFNVTIYIYLCDCECLFPHCKKNDLFYSLLWYIVQIEMKEWKQLNESNTKLLLTSLSILDINFLSSVCYALVFHIARLNYFKKNLNEYWQRYLKPVIHIFMALQLNKLRD